MITSLFRPGRALSLAAVAIAATLASCASPPPPPVRAPPPAISLSPQLIEQASAYRGYVTRATAISPAFVDGPSVSQAVRTGVAYEPKQLLRGAVAYGALVALQEPTFVAGVRSFAHDPDQRRTVAYEIMKDPAYAVGFAGSAAAAGLVIQALGDDGSKLLAQGKAVKQAAYDVQHSAWSKGDVAGRDGRLALAKQLSATAVAGDAAETARLSQSVAGGLSSPLGAGLTAPAKAPPYTPLVIRSLALAALSALGYGDDVNMAQLTPLMAEPAQASCYNMAKLNTYQCLAVSKPYYEDVFCLGQHMMMDTGMCLMKGAGVAPPIDIKPPPLKVGGQKVTSVSTSKTVKPAAKKR